MLKTAAQIACACRSVPDAHSAQKGLTKHMYSGMRRRLGSSCTPDTRCGAFDGSACPGLTHADSWPTYAWCRWPLIGGVVLAAVTKSGNCGIRALVVLLSSALSEPWRRFSQAATLCQADGLLSRLGRDRALRVANCPHSGASSRLGRDTPVRARSAAGVLAGRRAALLAASPKPGSCAPVFLPSRDFVSEMPRFPSQSR